MSSLGSSFLVAIALLLLHNVQSNPTKTDEVPLAIDLVSSEDVELKVPYLAHLREPWAPKRLQYNLDRVEPILEYIIEISDEIIAVDLSIKRRLQICANILVMVTKFATKKADPSMFADAGPEFDSDMFEMVEHILERGNQIETSMVDSREAKNIPRLKRQFRSLLITILEGLRKSPVVGHVNWQKGTVDGIEFLEYCAMIIGSQKYHGFISLTTLSRGVVDIARKFM